MVWKILLKSQVDNTTIDRVTLDNLNKTNSNYIIYDYLLGKKYLNDELQKYAKCWSMQTQENITLEEYLKLFSNLYKIMDVVKLRDFQYRLLLGKIFTNDILFRWGKKESNIWEYCLKSREGRTTTTSRLVRWNSD